MCVLVCCFTDMFWLFYWCVLWCVVSLMCCGVLYYWCGVFFTDMCCGGVFYWCVLYVVSLCCGVLFQWCDVFYWGVLCVVSLMCCVFHWCVLWCVVSRMCCVLFYGCVLFHWRGVLHGHRAASVMERPVCQCGLHIAFSRPRLAMLSDNVRNSTYLHVLRKVSGTMTLLINRPSPLVPHSC